MRGAAIQSVAARVGRPVQQDGSGRPVPRRGEIRGRGVDRRGQDGDADQQRERAPPGGESPPEPHAPAVLNRSNHVAGLYVYFGSRLKRALPTSAAPFLSVSEARNLPSTGKSILAASLFSPAGLSSIVFCWFPLASTMAVAA